jgi:hypothetical protein
MQSLHTFAHSVTTPFLHSQQRVKTTYKAAYAAIADILQRSVITLHSASLRRRATSQSSRHLTQTMRQAPTCNAQHTMR